MKILTKLTQAIRAFFVSPETDKVYIDPFGVEHAFCRPFEELPRGYTPHTISIVATVTLPNWADIDLSPEEIERMEAMKSRARNYLTVTIEERAYVYLAQVSDRMAVAMMYLTYIQFWACKHRCGVISFYLIRDKIFEDGFPSSRDLRSLWYAQKVKRQPGGSDNLIDYKEAQESIQL